MGARLGIIVAFLLSIVAAGGSYYLYKGVVEERWKRESVEAKYDQIKEKMLVVQSEKEQTNTEKEKYKAESEEYRNRAQAMQGQIEQLQNDQSKSKEAQDALEKQINDNLTTMAALQKKVEELDKKAKEAQQACVAKPEDLLPAAQPFGSPAVVPATAPTAARGEPATIVFSPSISSPPPIGPPATTVNPAGAAKTAAETPVKVEAPAQEVLKGPRVLTVNRKFNFVVVNQGIQDGLKMGDKLTVVNQDKGTNVTLQVEKLYDKFCAATILEENPQHQVAEGDEVRRG